MVSVIVPALNEASGIGETLRALQALQGEKEILVVDGGSTDATVAIAKESGAIVVTSNRGRGTQMHAGALAAKGDVLWFVHADTLPPAHAITELQAALQQTGVAGGNFGLLFDGDSRAAKLLTAIYPLLRRLNLCYGDSGIFVSRATYRGIGGFGPLALFEDLDLLRRLRRQGRFVHLQCRITTSSRRFENRNFLGMWLHWTAMQVLYWCGAHPNWLARWYGHVRKSAGS